MQTATFFEDLQARVSKLFDESPAADLKANLRALMQQGFEHFDLATREQLDLQGDLLARARTLITDLEVRVAKLEAAANKPQDGSAAR